MFQCGHQLITNCLSYIWLIWKQLLCRSNVDKEHWGRARQQSWPRTPQPIIIINSYFIYEYISCKPLLYKMTMFYSKFWNKYFLWWHKNWWSNFSGFYSLFSLQPSYFCMQTKPLSCLWDEYECSIDRSCLLITCCWSFRSNRMAPVT